MSLINFFRSLIFGSTTSHVASLDYSKNKFKFLLNDPTTPDLSLDTHLPLSHDSSLPVKVIGLDPNNHHVFGSDAWRASQAYMSVLNGINITQKSLERKLKKWATNKPLLIVPNAGSDLNAYYNRKTLSFFWAKHPATGQKISTADSVDVVAHELGHATLDALRPDLWNLMAIEIWSFHEAWADLMAIFTVMLHDEMLSAALKEVDGDMFKSNQISKLAEQMGNAIYHYAGGNKKGYSPDRLRDANNNFKYVMPEKLPQRTTDDQLANECHSFGRVFLGAYWEVVVRIYEKKNSEINDRMAALRYAATYGAKLLTRSAQKAPASARMYDSVARTMLIVEQSMENKYQDILNSVFSSRRILNKHTIKMLNEKKFSNFNFKDTDFIEVNPITGHTHVYRKDIQSLKISDNLGIRALSNHGNPLFMVEIEIPQDSLVSFDNRGNMIQSLSASHSTAMKSAKACLDFIHSNNLVKYDGFPADDDFTAQFSVHNEKLHRNYFV